MGRAEEHGLKYKTVAPGESASLQQPYGSKEELKTRMPTLSDIAELLNVPPPAFGDRSIRGANDLHLAQPDELSLVAAERFAKDYRATRAAAVIVDRKVTLTPRADVPTLVVENADLAMARVLELLAPPVPIPPVGRDRAAFVASSVRIGDNERIGFGAYVGDNCRIGKNVVIHPGVYVGADVEMGDDCVLYPGVVIRERVTLGHRVIVNANSTIGTDGFGYRWDGSKHAKIPQIGTVVIEDDVEIGSNSCVDRAKYSETRIGRGTKLDNLVQVAHNVRTGAHCIITGQVGIAGSTTLGKGVVLGGQTAVRDHIVLGDGAMAAACSGIMTDVDPGTVVSGTPALPHRQTLREQAALRQLPDLKVQLRKLTDEVEQLKSLLTARLSQS